MTDYLTHFVTYHKIYMITGALLLLLIIVPTKKKMSAKTQKALYLVLVVWLVCLGYRVSTGRDIISLFNKNDSPDYESRVIQLEASPFNKYYSNDAGREPQNGNSR